MGRFFRCERWGHSLLLGLGPVTIVCDREPDADGRVTLGLRVILG